MPQKPGGVGAIVTNLTSQAVVKRKDINNKNKGSELR